MMYIVVALLLGLWTLILAPGVVREFRSTSPRSSVDAFEKAIRRLDPAAPAARRSPRRRPPRRAGAREVLVLDRPARPVGTVPPTVLRRRRQVLQWVLASVPITLAFAVLLGGWVWWVHVASVAALATYLYLLARMQRAHALRAKVRRLPVARDAGHDLREIRIPELQGAGGGRRTGT